MRNYARQAAVALTVYLKRGRLALKSLVEGDPDAAEELLRWRTAAFHNFRVADTLALERGQDISSDQKIQQIWLEIRDLDQELKDRLEELYKHTGQAFTRIRSSRQTIGRYRSGNIEHSRFEHSV